MTLDNNAPLGHNGMMHTVSETRHYTSHAERLLSETERSEVLIAIAADPMKGDIVPGTGGVRKLRFAKGGKGKSGGVRVIYYYHDDKIPVLLLTVFGKNEKSNLSKAERNEMSKIVAAIKHGIRRNYDQKSI